MSGTDVEAFLARLFLEEVPTGEVRDWNPRRSSVTPEEAARHRAELEAAIRPSKRSAA